MMIALSCERNDGNINTLLAAGADITQKTRYGFTARDYAMYHNYREELFADNRWRKIFLNMVEKRDAIAVSEFNLGKPDLNLLKKSLREAVFADNLEMAVLLLRMGAPANSTNFDGETALMEAACRANVEMVKLLLSHGADVNLCDNDGETALEKMRVTFPVEGGTVRYYLVDFEADAEKKFGEKLFKEIKAAQWLIGRLLDY